MTRLRRIERPTLTEAEISWTKSQDGTVLSADLNGHSVCIRPSKRPGRWVWLVAAVRRVGELYPVVITAKDETDSLRAACHHAMAAAYKQAP